jgi:hypothetical protein
MNDDEDFLTDVVDVSICDTKVSQASPYKRSILIENGPQRGNFWPLIGALIR